MVVAQVAHLQLATTALADLHLRIGVVDIAIGELAGAVRQCGERQQRIVSVVTARVVTDRPGDEIGARARGDANRRNEAQRSTATERAAVAASHHAEGDALQKRIQQPAAVSQSTGADIVGVGQPLDHDLFGAGETQQRRADPAIDQAAACALGRGVGVAAPVRRWRMDEAAVGGNDQGRLGGFGLGRRVVVDRVETVQPTNVVDQRQHALSLRRLQLAGTATGDRGRGAIQRRRLRSEVGIPRSGGQRGGQDRDGKASEDRTHGRPEQRRELYLKVQVALCRGPPPHR
ncbi:hypothetical protein IXO159_16570 [Xanthomonas oryzae pv. oryzae]|nr:hypothetical protein ABM06_09620 [Xanthomonas oryzae pv. oryzae]AZK83318.1 hypothetical protein BO992_09910 [Xanthomonas oryzae pv. oryzae]OLH89379.1 hypothetical protein DXO216_11485 [Xanthomonas oryzae pv. oryzae]OLI25215.1 hypothetical protein IXO90_00645 [Xanthomonas oryzae pv. oryzae]OLI25330.1 hypothetical protein IXO93_17375 [Xanthomonas oryzae pv. oryzae]